MSNTITVLKPGLKGVDGTSNPLLIAGLLKVRHAINVVFQSGELKTRPGLNHQNLGLNGQFQGATTFIPSRGISAQSFADCGAQLITAVNGHIYVNGSLNTGILCGGRKLVRATPRLECERPVENPCPGCLWMYQAENWLIIQNPGQNTMWWNGDGPLISSEGMSWEYTGDSFVFENHKNRLVSAGLGVYAHGRIHQSSNRSIYVSDQVHRRGGQSTDDILLMEDQSLQDPLSVRSSMGKMIALVLSPEMGSVSGEGLLVGYFEGGVVTYNTNIFPRLTKRDGEGTTLVEGWETKPIVAHRLDTISAVGPNAVTALPRDQFFRSSYNIHILSQVLGVEAINDEPVNGIADDVLPVLSADNKDLLYGCATGYWLRGHRWFATTGMWSSPDHSCSPFGVGFVVWNKVWAKTADRTPETVWEGVWKPDDSIHGIHKFIHTGMWADRGQYGFLCSDEDRNIFFASIEPSLTEDVRDKLKYPIGWVLETGRFNMGDTGKTKIISGGRLEITVDSHRSTVRVFVRTERHPEWALWKDYHPAEIKLPDLQTLTRSKPLGLPPETVREAMWFEFRVEGTGYMENPVFEVEISPGNTKVDVDFAYRTVKAASTPLLDPTV